MIIQFAYVGVLQFLHTVDFSVDAGDFHWVIIQFTFLIYLDGHLLLGDPVLRQFDLCVCTLAQHSYYYIIFKFGFSILLIYESVVNSSLDFDQARLTLIIFLFFTFAVVDANVLEMVKGLLENLLDFSLWITFRIIGFWVWCYWVLGIILFKAIGFFKRIIIAHAFSAFH